MFYGSDLCVTSQMAKSPDTKSILELPAYLQPERANRVQSRPHRLDFLVVTEFTEHVGPEPLVRKVLDKTIILIHRSWRGSRCRR